MQTRNGPAGDPGPVRGPHHPVGRSPPSLRAGQGGGARSHVGWGDGGWTQPGHRELIHSNCVVTDATGPEPQPGSSVCPRRARNTAHNSSRGGHPDSCRGSRCDEWELFAPGAGCQGPGRPRAQREQWPGQGPRWLRLGLQLTARPGAPVPSRAQRGRFPGRRADVCTGVGVGAPPCRGRGRGASLPAAPGATRRWGQHQARPSLSLHPRASGPGNPLPLTRAGAPSAHHRPARC